MRVIWSPTLASVAPLELLDAILACVSSGILSSKITTPSLSFATATIRVPSFPAISVKSNVKGIAPFALPATIVCMEVQVESVLLPEVVAPAVNIVTVGVAFNLSVALNDSVTSDPGFAYRGLELSDAIVT